MAQPVVSSTQNDAVTLPPASSSSSSASATDAVITRIAALPIDALASSSPPRPITPRSPKYTGEHPLKHIAVNKSNASPRRMTEQAASSSPRSDTRSRAVDAQILEPMKNVITSQIAQVGEGSLSPDRRTQRARLYLQFAQTVHNDAGAREASLQKALEDLQSSWNELNRPDSAAQIWQLRGIRELAEQFEVFSRSHSSACTDQINELATQCIEKIKNLEAERGKLTTRFSLPGTE